MSNNWETPSSIHAGRKRRGRQSVDDDPFANNTPRRGRKWRSSRMQSNRTNPSLPYTDLLIHGHLVKLPPNMQPYVTQRTMIAKILISLKNRLNALIESPTGSGKTLGLLSASCAWLDRYKKERQQSHEECNVCNKHNVAASETIPPEEVQEIKTEPPEKRPILTIEDEFDADFYILPSPSSSKKNNSSVDYDEDDSQSKQNGGPHTCLRRVTIFYGTRTHKQISQVVKEFSRLPYGQEGLIKHTILASREHMCINPLARASGDINNKCKELTAPEGIGCSFSSSMRGRYESPSSVRQLISQTAGEASYVWDVEDLVEMLSQYSSPSICPYFCTSRVLCNDADIVFCPFTYLLDPVIRTSMKVNLKDAIVILDEAHNVEDVCREAASFSFTELEMIDAAVEFFKKALELKKAVNEGLFFGDEQKKQADELSANFEKVNSLIDSLLQWFISVARENLGTAKIFNDRFGQTVIWESLYLSFKMANLDRFENTNADSLFLTLWNAFTAIASATSVNEDQLILKKAYRPSGRAIVCIEKYLYFFKIYFQEDNRTAYKLFLCLDKPPKFGGGTQSENDSMPNDILDMKIYEKEKQEWTELNKLLHGYSEFKRNFRLSLNFWCMKPSLAYNEAFKACRSVILASGTLCPIETFSSELDTTFQQQMEGFQIIPREQIFAAVIPRGPSGSILCGTYKNMNSDSRFFDDISKIIEHVCKVIPKGVLCFLSSYRVLEQLYEHMETLGILRQIQSVKVVCKEPRRSSMMSAVMSSYESAVNDSTRFGPQCTGALMLAVFRGKVSEGIDFSNDLARCVITIGIPFPNVNDEQVIEKKKYNNDYCKKLQILSGDDWYTMQAYRALNQALGRCLRHRNDWGAILMLDERLRIKPNNPNALKVSKWIRGELRELSNYRHFIQELSQFTEQMIKLDEERSNTHVAAVKGIFRI